MPRPCRVSTDASRPHGLGWPGRDYSGCLAVRHRSRPRQECVGGREVEQVDVRQRVVAAVAHERVDPQRVRLMQPRLRDRVVELLALADRDGDRVRLVGSAQRRERLGFVAQPRKLAERVEEDATHRETEPDVVVHLAAERERDPERRVASGGDRREHRGRRDRQADRTQQSERPPDRRAWMIHVAPLVERLGTPRRDQHPTRVETEADQVGAASAPVSARSRPVSARNR